MPQRRAPRACLLALALLTSILICPVSGRAAPRYAAVDAAGLTVALAQPARRIVTLAPHLAELVHSAGAGDRLAGTVRHSDQPPQAGRAPVVGDAGRIDFERLAALAPDLVLAWRSGNAPADIGRLRQLGFAVFEAETRALEDIPRLLLAIGALAGTPDTARAAAADFERTVRILRVEHAAASRVRVFYEVWRRPLMTVNGAHYISEVLELCGGSNVFADAAPLTPTVPIEALIAARPEVVLGGTRPGGDENYAREWRAHAPVPLRDLPVFYVDPDLIQRPTTRLAEAARIVCAVLDRLRRTR